MIENICLYAFVGNPYFIGRKKIKFQWDTGFSRLKLTYHTGQVLVDGRQTLQIVSQIARKTPKFVCRRPFTNTELSI